MIVVAVVMGLYLAGVVLGGLFCYYELPKIASVHRWKCGYLKLLIMICMVSGIVDVVAMYVILNSMTR